MTLQEMYDEMARLVDEMRQYLDEHEDENGELTIEEAKTFDRMNQKVNALRKKIERHEQVAKVDNYLSEPITPTILNYPGSMGGGWNIPTTSDPFSKTHGGKNYMRHHTSDRYRREFIGAIRDHFQTAVTNSYLREGALPKGGYLVPTELDAQIVSALEDNNIMRQLCRVINTASDHKINIVASKPSATWTAEGESLNFSSEEFSQIVLEAYKLSIGLKISNELLADSFYDLESHIVAECAAALANAEESAFLLGDGNGKPTGLLVSIDANSDAVITTTGATISADDLIALEYKLSRPYRKDAVFITSDSAMEQIRRLKDSTGNFIWSPSLTENETARLLGHAIYTSQYMPPPLSGAISVIFGDMQKAYTIADRGTRSIQALHELFAQEDISAYILRQRCDGKLTDANAVKALKVK